VNGKLLKNEDIIELILSANRIKELRQIQKRALEHILKDDRRNLLVVAPSASGKTLIGEIACIVKAYGNKKSFYLVPLKALANEKFEDFFKKYNDFDLKITVSTGDFDISLDIIEKSDIIITTYERFDSILRKKPDWTRKIGVVVIDEIHNLGDKNRGLLLESLITRLLSYSYIQLIGLSATIKNPENLAGWLNAQLIKSEERPCELRYKIIKTSNKLKTIKELIPDLIENNIQTLIFTRTRKEAENLANRLKDIIKSKLSIEEILEIETYSESIIDSMLDFDIISSGVGYHHAGLDHGSRILVEKMFNNYLLKVICCTTTLASGLNTPAKVVIIKDVKMFNENTNKVEFIPRNKLHQIAGRAGRHSHDIGFAIILVSNEEEAYKTAEYYFKQKKLEFESNNSIIYEPIYDEIKSFFAINKYSLLNQVLVFIHHQKDGMDKKDLIKFLKKTYYYYSMSKEPNSAKLVGRFASISKKVEDLLSFYVPTDIPDNSEVEVILTKFVENSIEGIVKIKKEKINYTCNFLNNNKYCSCSDFKENEFCKHLYFLAINALKIDRKIAEDVILSSFNELFALEYLLEKKFIYIEDGKYKCTELGNLAVDLFLDVNMFLLIRNRIRYIETQFDFLELIKILTEMKYNKTISYHYLSVLNELTRIDNTKEISKILRTMTTNEIGLGDLENFIDTARWLTNAIINIAKKTIEGNDVVISIGKKLQAKISSPKSDNELIHNLVQHNEVLFESLFDIENTKITNIFRENLQYLLIIHKTSGTMMYSLNFSDLELDPALISGYLSAINSFGSEFSRDRAINIKKLEFDRFKIVMKEGKMIRVGIIIAKIDEDWMNEKLREFIEEVEQQFKDELLNWNGNTNIFRPIKEIFNRIFLLEES